MKRLSPKLIKQKLFSQIKNSADLKNQLIDKLTENINQTKTNLILQSEKINPIVWIQVLQDKLEKVAKSDKNPKRIFKEASNASRVGVVFYSRI